MAALLVPQVNVNDDTVLLVRWSVPQYAHVSPGDVVCEVETSKATAEVTAERAGVLMQSAPVGTLVRIGDPIGAIGPTKDALMSYAAAAERAMAMHAPAAAPRVKATSKARALAEEHGISLEKIAGQHALGTIKEADVRRFLADRGAVVDTRSDRASGLPPALLKYVERAGSLSPFEAAVARSLRRSTDELILTSVDADCRLDGAHELVRRSLARGRMVSLLHLVIAAAAGALPRFPRLASFAYEGTVYRYRSIDVGFVVRTEDGRLFTPVIRSADRLDADAIAGAAQAVMLRVLRGGRVDDLEGACLTVSHIPVAGTTRVAALPNFGQSAVLGVSAERAVVRLQDGTPVQSPVATLTLTYDHTICDGIYAAGFLADVVGDLERRS